MSKRLPYDLLYKEYVEEKQSIANIAKKYQTYPQRIFRLLRGYNIKVRSKSEAQKIVNSKEGYKHPTKGRERTNDEKVKISKGMKRKEIDES